MLKIMLAMLVWSGALGYGLYWLGVQNHMHDPLWAIGTGLALLIGIMVNVVLFSKLAGNKPWEWF